MTGSLLPYSHALDTILDRARPLGTESVDLHDLTCRVLAAPVTSEVDMPRFDNSAVDGYAISEADCLAHAGVLRVVGVSRAGEASTQLVEAGQAVQVFTGAPIPAGTAAVVMQEDADATGGKVRVCEPPRPGQHVRARGEEFRIGDRLLAPGTLCGPAQVALAASSGRSRFEVYRRPRVAVLTTGDELVSPGSPLADGQIYASNGLALTSALERLHLLAGHRLHARDDEAETRATVGQALRDCDVLLTAGGVSVGAHDYVRGAFEVNGIREAFWGVAIKPGAPMYFGTGRHRLVFGLPGNPVSALVCFQLFVRPALRSMLGLGPERPGIATLARDLHKKAGRAEFVRGVRHGREVVPIPARGSHMMGGLAAASCLIHLPIEATSVVSGSQVEVIDLRWGLE